MFKLKEYWLKDITNTLKFVILFLLLVSERLQCFNCFLNLDVIIIKLLKYSWGVLCVASSVFAHEKITFEKIVYSLLVISYGLTLCLNRGYEISILKNGFWIIVSFWGMFLFASSFNKDEFVIKFHYFTYGIVIVNLILVLMSLTLLAMKQYIIIVDNGECVNFYGYKPETCQNFGVFGFMLTGEARQVMVAVGVSIIDTLMRHNKKMSMIYVVNIVSSYIMIATAISRTALLYIVVCGGMWSLVYFKNRVCKEKILGLKWIAVITSLIVAYFGVYKLTPMYINNNSLNARIVHMDNRRVIFSEPLDQDFTFGHKNVTDTGTFELYAYDERVNFFDYVRAQSRWFGIGSYEHESELAKKYITINSDKDFTPAFLGVGGYWFWLPWKYSGIIGTILYSTFLIFVFCFVFIKEVVYDNNETRQVVSLLFLGLFIAQAVWSNIFIPSGIGTLFAWMFAGYSMKIAKSWSINGEK